MKHIIKLNKLADIFEQKLSKYSQSQSQFGTTELFFGNESTQNLFVKNIGQLSVQNDKVVGSGPVAKILADYRNKTEKPASFSMDITANPNNNAFFTVNVSPEELKKPVVEALANMFLSILKKSMLDIQKFANQKAKEGHGSGTNHVYDLDVE